MKFTNEDLSLEKGIQKEWIITNGIGGFASSTTIGVNTRKYHGLLIAATTPPARRFLVLSKIDESISINDKDYPLYTNMCKNYISEGYKNLKSFEKEYLPTFEYEVDKINITKQICMKYKENTVCILYTVDNKNKKSAVLKLAPIVNFRDFHAMSTNADFNLKQYIDDNLVKIIVNDNLDYSINMYCDKGQYIKHEHDIFNNMYYIEEEKRGFYPEENHAVPGRYEVEIKPNSKTEISIVCSLNECAEKVNVKSIIKKEIKRIEKVLEESEIVTDKQDKKSLLTKELVKASDNFVVYRPSFKLHTLIAGYPWFLDWGRDALLSLEGLLLLTKRFNIAKEVLQTFLKNMKEGITPNGYSGYDNRPLYNSVDSSLFLIDAVRQYAEYTNDYDFVKKIYGKLKDILKFYINGTNLDGNNIYLDKDGLIVSGTESTQNTWMDAKIGSLVVTPRNGKAVEINSLWYNALKIMEDFSDKFKDEETNKLCATLSKKCKLSFKKAFYNEKNKCLDDVVGDSKIRPNQLAAISLKYPIINPASAEAKNIFDTVTKKLLNKYGIKTLAKGEKGYVGTYEGDGFKRDMSYHQGITWTGILGEYARSYKNIIEATTAKTKKEKLQKEYEKFVDNVTNTFYKEITTRGCIGSVSEIYDSTTPYLPKGAFAQAWSVAKILEILARK